MINFSTSILDINTTINGIHTQLVREPSCVYPKVRPNPLPSYRISGSWYLVRTGFYHRGSNLTVPLDLCLYGVRTAAYGVLAIGDPVSLTCVLRTVLIKPHDSHSFEPSARFASYELEASIQPL